ncbi:MAG TPA: hypothetical protein VHV78_08135 [Gemmatimonadaceae bacterium]|nr:hypothetical protein [Gemmatimonadaceae bacterium]
MSSTPQSANDDSRFVSFSPPAGTAAAFAIRQLRSTMVLRWGYAPGPTLFFAWSHERDGNGSDPGSWGTDISDLLSIHPVNTVTMKVSQWLGG